MPAYDGQSFQPPAPVASVTLRDPHSGNSVANTPLLIDTGADVTLLPRSSIEKLGLKSDSEMRYELAGFDGHQSFASAVDLDLVFAETVVRGRYLVIEGAGG